MTRSRLAWGIALVLVTGAGSACRARSEPAAPATELPAMTAAARIAASSARSPTPPGNG